MVYGRRLMRIQGKKSEAGRKVETRVSVVTRLPLDHDGESDAAQSESEESESEKEKEEKERREPGRVSERTAEIKRDWPRRLRPSRRRGHSPHSPQPRPRPPVVVAGSCGQSERLAQHPGRRSRTRVEAIARVCVHRKRSGGEGSSSAPSKEQGTLLSTCSSAGLQQPTHAPARLALP